jgi:hypothetical protein
MAPKKYNWGEKQIGNSPYDCPIAFLAHAFWDSKDGLFACNYFECDNCKFLKLLWKEYP